MQTHAHMHTRTHRDTDACMDGCTHNVSWIAGDKRRMIARMSFTSDCKKNLGCIFQKNPGGMIPCVHADTCTKAYTHRHRRMHGCIIYKGNSLKSLSREVVTSAALFTRLTPRCTQERVNQARGYTRRPDAKPVSSSSTGRSFPVPLGTGTRLRHAMAALRDEGRPFTRYIGTLYTIRVRMTVVEVELKPFALQWGLQLLYVASYAWLSDEV